MIRFLKKLFQSLKKEKEMPVLPFFKAPERKVSKVFIHCSASNNLKHDCISVMRKWHTSPDPNDPSKPWSDVGYHYFIKFNGDIQQGRDLEIKPSAQGRHNPGSIAICLHGLKKDDFTEAQFDALAELCSSIRAAIPDVSFHGHCEVSNKACPVFDYRKALGLDSNGKMKGFFDA